MRRECLDHVVVLSERHLRCILTAYFAYYHGAKIKWNPTEHKFISGGDDKWLTREYRGDWKIA